MRLALAAALAVALTACGIPGGRGVAQEAGPEPAAIVAALLAAEATALAALENCAPGLPDAPAETLGQDIAGHLAMIGSGGGVVSTECWPPEDGRRTCTVGIGRDAGEEVWTRFYRFSLTPAGGADTDALTCFTIP